MRTKQLSFLPKARLEHGGSVRAGKRKEARPFSSKLPIHLSLKAAQARGSRSMIHQKWRIHELLSKLADRYEIKLYRYANVGNHLHLLIQAKNKKLFQGFLREFSGRVAQLMTGAIKGMPEKFWDHLAYSKLISWGRQFENVLRYLTLNVMESFGRRDRDLLKRLEQDGYVILGPSPPRYVPTP